jgi:multidrug efflux pump subunit AcrA (membrane-fusion protein)
MPAELAPRPSLQTESEMLPQEPPPWFVRSTAWLLISMFGVALLAAIVVRLPETVTCPFVLGASQGADPIQSPRQAVVHQVAVSEGQQIKAREPLFVLGSDEIRGWDTQSRTLGEDLRAHEESLAKADAAYASQLEIKTAEISQSESEVKFREKHTSTSRDLVTRMEKLSKRGGISQVELIKYRLEAAESEKDLSVAQRTLQQVNYDRERMKTEHARQRNEDLAEIEKIKFRLSALKGDMENSQANLLTVRAPYDAVVISVAQRNAGNVVQSGQELCQLARIDSNLRARLVVSEAGVPKLAVGQHVRLFMDAFPYQRYGVVNAKLDWVSPSAVASSEGLHFIALASLDSESRRRPLSLRVGMGGQARIVVGQRTMIEYAFEPIRQLRENLRQ